MTSELSRQVGLRYAGLRHVAGGERFVTFISRVSLIGMALGVAAMVVVVSVMNGFYAELKRRILGAIPHVVIEEGDGAYSPVGGVAAGAAFLRQNALIVDGDGSHLISLFGIDPAAEASMSNIPGHMVAGEIESISGNDIVLGAPLAWRLGLVPGDAVTVILPEAVSSASAIRPRLARFRLAATFELDAEPDYHLGLVPVEFLAGVLERERVDTRLRLDDVLAAPRIAEDLAAEGNRVGHWGLEYGDFFRTVRMEKVMMFVLLFLVVVIAAFNIISSLAMMVREKQPDIAVLRTMGMTPAGIQRIFVTQGMTTGCLGVIVGLLLGLPLAFYVAEIVAFFESLAGGRLLAGTYFDRVPVQVRPTDVVLIAIMATVASFLAALYPARRAARLEPARILRYE